MAETITIYSFGDVDRGGKVRWMACELGLDIDEQRVAFGAQYKPPYTDLNPFGHVPTAKFRGEVLNESTAICHHLAEAFDEPKLWIGRGEPERQRYLFWLAVFGESFEGRLVECAVSKAGIIGPEYFDLHQKILRRKLRVAATQLPAEGFLCGDQLTVADVVAGYNLRLALACDLVERDAVAGYVDRLRARPAAEKSRIFASLDA